MTYTDDMEPQGEHSRRGTPTRIRFQVRRVPPAKALLRVGTQNQAAARRQGHCCLWLWSHW